jgi:hypothetical protein
VASVSPGPLPDVRTFALTDVLQAAAARRAAQAAIEASAPTAVIYCSTTAALLWQVPGAIWLDATAAENRPGRHGVWQRPAERRRLAQAPLILEMSEGALGTLATAAPRSIVVRSPVEPSAAHIPDTEARDIAAVTYAGDPVKKRLDVVLAAWQRARRPSETLVVAGAELTHSTAGVTVAGRLPPAEYRALLRRARVFVAAPRREDYGIAPLEALADGCLLVTTPAPGAYPALSLARALDPRLVGDDLERSLRIALDDPLPGYAERAAELLAPFRRRAVDDTISSQVLPALLPGWPGAHGVR